MSLIERFGEYVRACFTGLWIESHEHQDALLAISRLCHQEEWRLSGTDDGNCSTTVESPPQLTPPQHLNKYQFAATKLSPCLARETGRALFFSDQPFHGRCHGANCRILRYHS
jgi:hypothetical protein